MKKSINTFLKHPMKDNVNRSANPPVIRASTILFNSMQEMMQHEKKVKSHKDITHYTYGRYGSTTTIELESMLKQTADTYDDDVEVTIDALVSLLEPVIIIVMGLFVGVLVMSILMPILDMSSSIQ